MSKRRVIGLFLLLVGFAGSSRADELSSPAIASADLLVTATLKSLTIESRDHHDIAELEVSRAVDVESNTRPDITTVRWIDPWGRAGRLKNAAVDTTLLLAIVQARSDWYVTQAPGIAVVVATGENVRLAISERRALAARARAFQECSLPDQARLEKVAAVFADLQSPLTFDESLAYLLKLEAKDVPYLVKGYAAFPLRERLILPDGRNVSVDGSAEILNHVLASIAGDLGFTSEQLRTSSRARSRC